MCGCGHMCVNVSLYMCVWLCHSPHWSCLPSGDWKSLEDGGHGPWQRAAGRRDHPDTEAGDCQPHQAGGAGRRAVSGTGTNVSYRVVYHNSFWIFWNVWLYLLKAIVQSTSNHSPVVWGHHALSVMLGKRTREFGRTYSTELNNEPTELNGTRKLTPFLNDYTYFLICICWFC